MMVKVKNFSTLALVECGQIQGQRTSNVLDETKERRMSPPSWKKKNFLQYDDESRSKAKLNWSIIRWVDKMSDRTLYTGNFEC